jgi:hypothetical protein
LLYRNENNGLSTFSAQSGIKLADAGQQETFKVRHIQYLSSK